VNQKDQILAHATETFLQYGFKSVTMDDIAQKLGVSKKQSIPILRIRTNW
jgi:AcrR family transcriptional regulator